MNKRILLLLVALVVVVFVVYKLRKPEPETAFKSTPSIQAPAETSATETSVAPDEDTETKPVTEAVTALAPETQAESEPEIAVAPEPVKVEATVAHIKFSGDSFSVKSDQVLAVVAGTEITLKSLMPIAETTATEREVSAAEFDQLLQKAIDREVVMQTARRGNIMLNEEQRRVVEKARLRAGAAGFSLPEAERPEFEAKSNFESFDLMSSLYIESMAKAAGVPAKDLGTEEEYQKNIRKFLDELREKSDVTVNAVVEK
jgi:hypothetical protein